MKIFWLLYFLYVRQFWVQQWVVVRITIVQNSRFPFLLLWIWFAHWLPWRTLNRGNPESNWMLKWLLFLQKVFAGSFLWLWTVLDSLSPDLFDMSIFCYSFFLCTVKFPVVLYMLCIVCFAYFLHKPPRVILIVVACKYI